MLNRKRKEQIIGGIIVAVIAIGLAAFWFTTGHMSDVKGLGFLVGLCTGICSAVAGQMWKQRKENWILRLLFIVLGPIGMFFIMPFSPRLAVGYFLGSSASFGASWALAHLMARNENLAGSENK